MEANSHEYSNKVIEKAKAGLKEAGASLHDPHRVHYCPAAAVIKAHAYREILRVIANGEVENPGQLAHDVLYLEEYMK